MKRLPTALLTCLLALAPAGSTAQTPRARKPAPAPDDDPFAAALHVIGKMDPDDDDSAQSLARLARDYAEAGRFDDALRSAASIKDDEWKAHALGELANRLAGAGRLDESAEVVAGLVKVLEDQEGWPDELARGALRRVVCDERRRGREAGEGHGAGDAGEGSEGSEGALARLVEARHAKAAGLLEAAHEFLGWVEFGENEEATVVLVCVARRSAELGDDERAAEALAQADEAARRLEDDSDRALALCALAAPHVEAGRADEAAKFLEAAFEAGSSPGAHGSPALAEVAGLYARLGMKERALAAVEALVSKDEKARALSAIARAERAAGRDAEAARLQLRALETLAADGGGRNSGRTLEEFLRGGVASPEVLVQAAAAARALDDVYERAHALSRIGDRHAAAGRAENALELWDEALHTVGLRNENYGADGLRILNDGEKVGLLRSLARRLLGAAESGRVTEAARAVEANYWHGLTQAGGGEGVVQADLALAGLADELLRAGRKQEALEVVAAAARVVRHDGPNVWPTTRVEALAAVGSVYARAGDRPRAEAYFRRALDAAGALEDDASGDDKAEVLGRIGTRYAEAGLKPDPRARRTLRRIVRGKTNEP